MVHMLESPALAITRIRRFCVICLYASPSPQFAALFIRPALNGEDDDGDPSQRAESCSVFFYIVYFNKVFTIVHDLKAHKIVIIIFQKRSLVRRGKVAFRWPAPLRKTSFSIYWVLMIFNGFPSKLIKRNLRVNLVRRRSNKTRLSLNACRFEICHDHSNWRTCKICASCVKISRKQGALLQNLRKNKRFAPTKGIPNSYSYISLNYTIRIYLSFVLVYLLQCYL